MFIFKPRKLHWVPFKENECHPWVTLNVLFETSSIARKCMLIYKRLDLIRDPRDEAQGFQW
jgi:hypothetical protein